jgi:hypothetical protein
MQLFDQPTDYEAFEHILRETLDESPMRVWGLPDTHHFGGDPGLPGFQTPTILAGIRDPRQPLFAPPAYSSVRESKGIQDSHFSPRRPIRRSHECPSRERKESKTATFRTAGRFVGRTNAQAGSAGPHLQVNFRSFKSPNQSLHNTRYHSLSAPSRRTAKTRLGHDESRTITPTTYWPFATDRPFTETRLAPQLDPGTNDVRIATPPMPAILVFRRPA